MRTITKTYPMPFMLLLISLFTSQQYLHAQDQANTTTLKTASGLVYKIFPGNNTEKPKAGEFIKFNLKYTVGPKDSLLQSTYNSIPAYMAVDTGNKVQYSFMEIAPKLSAGDSAEVIMSIDSLVNKKIMPGYNPIFQQGSDIKCELKLLDIFKSDSAVQKDYAAELEVEKNREIKVIENYMAQKGIHGTRTASGAFVVIETTGDTTLKAEPGKTASIKYKGYLLNGNIFDTNMDSSKGHTDPIDVLVGEGKVIKGWDEALPYFGKGSRGKILVPAMLGYGPQPMGNDIPAFSNLVFDIEIVDVKAAQ